MRLSRKQLYFSVFAGDAKKSALHDRPRRRDAARGSGFYSVISKCSKMILSTKGEIFCQISLDVTVHASFTLFFTFRLGSG